MTTYQIYVYGKIVWETKAESPLLAAIRYFNYEPSAKTGVGVGAIGRPAEYYYNR